MGNQRLDQVLGEVFYELGHLHHGVEHQTKLRLFLNRTQQINQSFHYKNRVNLG